MTISDIDRLKVMMQVAGADKLYVKRLVPNDNSKNQPYLGGGFLVLNILPYGEVSAEKRGKTPNFKAAINFYWLLDNGSLEHAPHAQFILYPKYPEVRLSGFLKGCQNAPSDIMNSRTDRRVLFLGVTGDGRIIGHAAMPDSDLVCSLDALGVLPAIGVFNEITLGVAAKDTRKLLLDELCRISLLDWIHSKRLLAFGKLDPCVGTNCGGVTLEAELGIMSNSNSEPDFHGWEVKQHSVTNLGKPNSSVLTLMTPEPTAGYYREKGVEAFIRKYGYKDKKGREDRWNFGGAHKVGVRDPSTGLTMILDGYDPVTRKIIKVDGGVVLRDDGGNHAAEWKFTHIMDHWQRKHARAVYIPSVKRNEPLQYRYGSKVRLGIGTDPLKLLEAMSVKAVYYDPGIKLEKASTSKPTTKRRSQFRVHIKNIANLYNAMEQVSVCEE